MSYKKENTKELGQIYMSENSRVWRKTKNEQNCFNDWASEFKKSVDQNFTVKITLMVFWPINQMAPLFEFVHRYQSNTLGFIFKRS